MFHRLVTDVGTAALSVEGRNDTPYLSRSSSGIDHHAVASTTAGAHQARIRQGRAGRDRASRNSTAATSTGIMAEALVPPHAATAAADWAAARACPRPPRLAGPASGNSTHGSIAAGRNCADSTPSKLTPIGDMA